MNVDNTSRALTIYVGDTNTNKGYVTNILQKLYDLLKVLFLKRSRLLSFFLIEYFLFIFLGSCIAAKSSFVFCYVYDILFDETTLIFLIGSLVITTLSSFSIFGKIIPAFLCCMYAFFIGVIQYSMHSYFTFSDRMIYLLFLCLLSVFSFLVIILLCESFLFAKFTSKGKSAYKKSKPIVLFLLFSCIDTYLISITYSYIINFLMLG